VFCSDPAPGACLIQDPPPGGILGASGVGTDPLRVSLPRALRPLPAALIRLEGVSEVSDLTPRAPGSGAWRPLSPGAAVLSLPPGTRDFRTSPPAFLCRASRHGLGGKARAPGTRGARSPPIRYFYPACDLRRLTGDPLRRILRAIFVRRAATPALFRPRLGRPLRAHHGGSVWPGARLARAGRTPAPQRRGPFPLGSAAADPWKKIEAPGRSQLPGAVCQAEAGEIPARPDTDWTDGRWW